MIGERQGEEARRSGERYRAMPELPGIGVAQADPATGRLLHVNPELCEITGYSSEELLGMTFAEITHPEHRGEDLERLRGLAHGETSSEHAFETRCVRKDGSVVWVGVNARLLRDEDGHASTLAVIQDVTERKRAEEALRSSEERYRVLYEDSPSMYFTLNTRGTVLSVNRFGAEQLGYAPEEIVGHPVLDVFHPEDREGVLRYLSACLRNPERVVGWEARKVRKDGSILWVREHARVVRSLDTGTAVLLSCEDVTGRKRAEEALRESNERIENILESITDAFLALDHEWRFTYLNPEAERVLCRTREELLGRNVWEEFPDAVGSAFYREYHRAVGERTTVEFEEYYPPLSTWFEVRAYPSEDGLSVYFRDISERKRTEKEVETRTRQQAGVAELGRRALAETDLSALADEAAALVARTLDVEYCEVLELLPGGDELLLRAGVGWKEGLIGRARVGAGLDSQAGYTLLSDEAVIVEDLNAEERFVGSPLLREHGVVSGASVVIRGRDRPFGVLGAHTKSSRRTFTEDDVNFLWSVANVLATAVERKRSEEALREVREAERGRLARDLHDEALQDLTYALAATQLVRKETRDPEIGHRLKPVAEALKRAGQGIRGAIYDLRLEGERGRTLVEMLEALVELNRAMSPDRELGLVVEDGVPARPLGEGAMEELLRIVQEALANVRRHADARRARVCVGVSGGKLRVEVADDGLGFDPAKAHPNGMGTRGMRERARALGGDLRIRSEPGKGTKVRFELPLDKEVEEGGEAARILLVEDHASFRQAAASVLESERGLEVVGQAGSLSEARELLGAGPVDVALVDLGLPDGYGGELIKELREKNPRAQSLVLTANLDKAEVARSVEAGAAGVLHKSVDMEEIVEAVRRLRAGETLMPLEEVVELLRLAGSRREEEHEARRAIEQLTPREKEVLSLLAGGCNSQEIAERLHISVRTQRNHVSSILAKLGVHSQLQAVLFALRHGVADLR